MDVNQPQKLHSIYGFPVIFREYALAVADKDLLRVTKMWKRLSAHINAKFGMYLQEDISDSELIYDKATNASHT